jgi:hypothetical protein
MKTVTFAGADETLVPAFGVYLFHGENLLEDDVADALVAGGVCEAFVSKSQAKRLGIQRPSPEPTPAPAPQAVTAEEKTKG